MASDESRMMLAVFDSLVRVEGAVAMLLDAGLTEDRIAIISPGDDPARLAEALAACGVAEESATYYASEVRGGRLLLVVRASPADVVTVLGAFGRHCGCVRVPPETQDGN
jgi:hypothetical protein